MLTITRLSTVAIAGVFAAGLVLTGCSSEEENSATSTHASAHQTVAGIEFSSVWVKAADKGMTGVFGKLKNTTDQDIVIAKASFPGAESAELHDTVAQGGMDKMMMKVDDGFTIEPGKVLDLVPGGRHVMLMGLTKPITAGSQIDITLIDQDGKEIMFSASARDFSGAGEKYEGDHAHGEGDHAHG